MTIGLLFLRVGVGVVDEMPPHIGKDDPSVIVALGGWTASARLDSQQN
jgi:hypothetical protein